MMISIILSILKIIGIVLLCILAFLITVVLVVLFVPIRYKIVADSDINDENKDYHVTAKFSWLLWLVRGRYSYPSKEGLVVKVGPFTVYDAKKKEKTSQKNTTNKKKKNKQETDLQNNSSMNNNDLENRVIEEDIKEDTSTLKESIAIENTKRKSFKEKIVYTWQKICDKINKVFKKIKYILANIKKYVGIVQTGEFKEAFELCKGSLARLFGMIKPRKLKVVGKVGMKSPDQTGYVCAVIGVISPFFKKQIHIIPDFENFVVKGNVLVKGRIYIFVILIIGIKVFFDKNIRKVIDMFKQEVVVDEQQ